MRARGFTYLGLLIFFVVASGAIAATIQVWHTVMRHEKEAELLFIGNEFRNALTAYYDARANSVIGQPVPRGQFPTSLDALVKDDRFLGTQRWLRKIYVDPMTGKAEWGLTKTGNNQISGVYSLSGQEPLKKKGFMVRDTGFEDKLHYSDWVFTSAALVSSRTPASGPAMPGAPKPTIRSEK